ncbi:MAG: peptidyl-prolyl cis-trans isomerase [Alphaproteobacteria bacterium]|nr:MAG: peptidyl-prolyl cis-trans isomerase [Alphaproteobacteria bacterium]
MVQSKWLKWGSVVLTVLIIASFVLQDRYGLISSTQKHFAKIDGKSINNRKFFQLLDHQIKSIKEKSPHLTMDDFKMAHFPEQVLDEYIGSTVRILELRHQGFTVSEDMLIKKLNQYGQNFNLYFNQMDPERKKVMLEDVRREIVEQQLVLPYQFPKGYQKLIHQSFNSDRVIDVITIDYSSINVSENPAEDELQAVIEQNPQAFMTQEKRSFYLINLSRKKYNFTQDELQTYYKKHKEAFIGSDKKPLIFSKALPEVEAQLRFAKIAEAAKNLKARIENDEINIDDIEAQGYRKETFKKMTKETLFTYSLPVLNFAFEQELNVLSDVFEDPATGDLFVVQVYEIDPETQMKGAELQKAAKKMWSVKKKEEKAKQDLETLYQLERKVQEFYEFVAKRKFKVRRNVAINRAMQKTEGLNPELLFRVFQTSADGKMVYIYTDKGITLARIIKDELYKGGAFETKQAAQFFGQTAHQTVMSTFLQHLSTRHKIEKDVDYLYQEIQF